ncbi:MAG: tol-pal system YbgF family protein [Thermoanaerobaculia bacterium]
MRLFVGLLLVAILAACGGTPEPQPMPVQAAAVTPPDPRVAEMQILLNELLDRLEVMNARIQSLEADAVRPAPASAKPPARTPAPVTAQPPRTTAPRQATTAPAQTMTAALGDEYRQAITLFGGGRLDDARTAFQRIFESDPSGDLADNALYWIAETHYAQGRYGEAIVIYRRIMDEYSQQNKAPDSMLKAGLAYARLGDLDMARRMLQDLTSRYPYSTPAANARHELERLKY